jgi:hypothetical protein
MRHRLPIFAAACALAGVLAAPSVAAGPPMRPGGVHSVSTAHFKVWYDSDSTQ